MAIINTKNIRIYNNGVWKPLINNKIYQNGSWKDITIANNAAIYNNGDWYRLVSNKYYNGYMHDLSEPLWTSLQTLPYRCRIWRDIDGNYYNNLGYASNIWQKRNISFQQVGSNLTVTNGFSNRNMPYIITNFNNENKDVLIFPNYNQSNVPTFINLENFTNNGAISFTAGAFQDSLLNTSPAIPTYYFGVYFGGSCIYIYDTDVTLVLLYNNWLIKGDFSNQTFCNSLSTFNCFNNLMANYIFANEGFLCVAAVSSSNSAGSINILVFDYDVFMNTQDFDAAYLRTISNIGSMSNTGLDIYYIYDSKIVTVDFRGNCKVYDINNGTNLYNASIGGDSAARYFWRNKILSTSNMVVTTVF